VVGIARQSPPPQPAQRLQSLRTVVALRASDGVQHWSSGTLIDDYAAVGTLIATSDAVYLTTRDRVQAYRASDGKSLWTAQPDEGDIFPMLPLAAGGVLYLPTYGSGVSAVRASDGTRLCKAGDNLNIHAIALAENMLYVAAELPTSHVRQQDGTYTNTETIYAYDAATCTLLWRYDTASLSAARALVAGSSTVYVVTDNGGIDALRAADGKLLWHRDGVGLRDTGWAFGAQPAMIGDTLFVTAPLLYRTLNVFASDGLMHIYAIAPDGSDYWHTPVGHVTSFL
jgi:outer membrane protein assembly factor BamB